MVAMRQFLDALCNFPFEYGNILGYLQLCYHCLQNKSLFLDLDR